ncbi:MAG: hypothetical protein NTY94_07765 [Alphaproteobacteria bacterium]|nr:hypothetical protein [Alphaproteobacteria bacterium]
MAGVLQEVCLDGRDCTTLGCSENTMTRKHHNDLVLQLWLLENLWRSLHEEVNLYLFVHSRGRESTMPHTTFIAFSSSDPLLADTITSACDGARSAEFSFVPWNRNDTSGKPIGQSVQSWVGSANALIADISEPNHNVTFEIGLALGLGNPVRLIKAASKDRKHIEEIGLLHNLGHDSYSGRSELEQKPSDMNQIGFPDAVEM